MARCAGLITRRAGELVQQIAVSIIGAGHQERAHFSDLRGLAFERHLFACSVAADRRAEALEVHVIGIVAARSGSFARLTTSVATIGVERAFEREASVAERRLLFALLVGVGTEAARALLIVFAARSIVELRPAVALRSTKTSMAEESHVAVEIAVARPRGFTSLIPARSTGALLAGLTGAAVRFLCSTEVGDAVVEAIAVFST